MADQFSNFGTALDSPAGGAYAVTTSDGADQAVSTRGIYVGGAGNVKLTTVFGQDVTFTAVPVGAILPVRAARIWTTGTTATNLVGMY